MSKMKKILDIALFRKTNTVPLELEQHRINMTSFIMISNSISELRKSVRTEVKLLVVNNGQIEITFLNRPTNNEIIIMKSTNWIEITPNKFIKIV